MQDVMTALSCFLFEDLENDRLYFGGLCYSSSVPRPSRVTLFQS